MADEKKIPALLFPLKPFPRFSKTGKIGCYEISLFAHLNVF